MRMTRNKFFILILIFAGLSFPARCAWLDRVPQVLRQPDGTVLHCLASGDEYYNWLHDTDGYMIMQDPASGYFVYALPGITQPVPSGLIPGRDNPVASRIPKGLRPDPEDAYSKRARRESIRSLKSLKGTANIGTLNNIVVFIRFSDQSEYTQLTSYYSNAFNATGTVSMSEYFKETSASQLTISTTLYPQSGTSTVVSYQDVNPRSYYMKYNAITNPNGYQNETESTVREMTLLKNATESVKVQIEATGMDFDFDDDTRIDNVTYIVQGATEGWSDLLWPHMWALYYYDVLLAGARVWNYNFQLSDAFGVSVLCHEMFHSLGAPDLYHYSSTAITPVGPWDVMATNRTPPQHMSAWMKYKYGGWTNEVPEITSDGTYYLSPLASSPFAAYRILSPFSASEFFVVEYRKTTGRFESSLSGSGLIIYRVTNALDGNANGPPDEVYVYRPGGTTTENGSINEAFFSSEAGRTNWGTGTDPACFLSNGSTGGITIENISPVANTISFSVRITSQFGFNPPRNLTAIANNTTATLSWDLPIVASPILTGFRIYRNSVQIFSGTDPQQQQYIDPGLAEGTYSYEISALYITPLGESDRSNSATVTIVNPMPDLLSDHLTIQPNPVLSGQSLLIQCHIHNHGTAASGPALVRGHFSADESLDPNDPVLFETALPALSAGQSYPVSQVYSLPTEIADGQWFILINADPGNAVPESNETNNLTRSSFTVRKSYPDAEPIHIETQAFWYSGASIEVPVEIINNGPAQLNPVYNRLFLSLEDVWNGSSSLLCSFQSPVLSSGESYRVVLSFDIDGNIPPDQYYLVLEADYPDGQAEQDEWNNILFQPLALLRPLPDLAVGGIRIQPSSIGQGHPFSIDFQVENLGLISSSDFSVTLIVSADTLYSEVDTRLDRVSIRSLQSKEKELIHLEPIMPATLSPGFYYLLIKADPDEAVYELSESNNLIYKRFEILDTSGKTDTGVFGGISVYPNPVTDNLFISQDISDAPIRSLRIIGVRGSICLEADNLPQIRVISLSTAGLRPGYYFLVFVTDRGTKTVPFVKVS